MMMKKILSILLSLVMVLTAAFAFAESEAAQEAPSQAEAPAVESAAEPEAEPAADTQAPVLLATVAGEEVYSNHADLEYWINYYMYQLGMSGYDTSDPELVQTVNQYSLYNTMRFIVIRKKAAELGLDQFTDEDLASMNEKAKAEWDSIVESYMTEFGITAESTEEDKSAARADAEATLLEEGYDEATYISEYVSSEHTNTLINRLRDQVSADVTVTDEDVQAYYNDLVQEDMETYGQDIGTYEFYTQYYQQPSYYTPEGYRAVNHILLAVDETLLNNWKDLTARYEEQLSASEDLTDVEVPEEETPEDEVPAEEEPAEAEPAVPETPAPPAEAEATPAPTAEPVTEEMVKAAEQAILDSVQPTVDEIMAKREQGVSFDDLILEYGTDPGMQDAATRANGYLVHKDSILWDPAFTAAAMELEKVGDVSKPFVGQYGVHILQYLKDVPGGAAELTDEMKEEFRSSLLDEKKDAALNTALEQWMQEADIVYTAEGEAWKLPENEPAGEDAEESDEAEDDEAEEDGEAQEESEAVEQEVPAEEAPAIEVPATEEEAAP